jgi:hypothetical protein
MNRIAPAVLTLLTFGCGFDKADGFRQGFPKSEAVTIKIPGSTGSALSGEATRRDGLEGDKAGLYVLTRGVTLLVNAGGAAVLLLVKSIADHPATSVTGSVAVWGPHTDPLSPNTYRFTVTRVKTDEYSYVLEAKGKTEADSAFRTILSGSHTVTGPELGSGSFLLDWNVASTLPEHDDNVGTAKYTYSRTSTSAQVKIDALFTQVNDRDTGKKVDVDYAFTANPGQGGNFEFKLTKDLAAGAALETASVKSRWQESGAGRSDVKVNGGNLTAVATMSECWDSGFASRFLLASFAANAGWGQESACAFSTAEYSTVAP